MWNYQFSDIITKNFQFPILLHKIGLVLLVATYVGFHPFLEFSITHLFIVQDLFPIIII